MVLVTLNGYLCFWYWMCQVPDAWGGVCIEEDACSKITLASLSEM